MNKLKIDYHDSYLIKVDSDIKNDTLELSFTDGKNQSKVCFFSVKRSEINYFTIGNIIADIEIYSGETMKDYVANHPSFKSLFSIEKEESIFKNIVAKIKQEKLIYASIDSSYGCEANIICERIEEIPAKDWNPWENMKYLKK